MPPRFDPGKLARPAPSSLPSLHRSGEVDVGDSCTPQLFAEPYLNRSSQELEVAGWIREGEKATSSFLCRLKLVGDYEQRGEKSGTTSASSKVELVATDEHKGYCFLGKGLPDEVIRHSAGEYLRGHFHTQSIKSFWSLLKRA